MTLPSQGDIVKLTGYSGLFLVISKNAFIRITGMFHVSPLVEGVAAGPLHVPVAGRKKTSGTVICEELKLIDPVARGGSIRDRISYAQMMEVSDVIQGIFEYD